MVAFRCSAARGWWFDVSDVLVFFRHYLILCRRLSCLSASFLIACTVCCICLVYLSYQQCYNTLPLTTYTTACDNFLQRTRQYPYSLSLSDCGYVLPILYALYIDVLYTRSIFVLFVHLRRNFYTHRRNVVTFAQKQWELALPSFLYRTIPEFLFW